MDKYKELETIVDSALEFAKDNNISLVCAFDYPDNVVHIASTESLADSLRLSSAIPLNIGRNYALRDFDNSA